MDKKSKPVVNITGAMISKKGAPAQVCVNGTWYNTSPVIEYYQAKGGFVETQNHIYKII